MASTKEIKAQLKLALDEIGTIVPWYDKRFKAWIFSSPLYPSVEYAGQTKEEVIKNYKYYLKDFIIERLKNNIESAVEKTTKGKGGYRPGAGRPKGSTKEPTNRITLPLEVVEWLKDKTHLAQLRSFIKKTA